MSGRISSGIICKCIICDWKSWVILLHYPLTGAATMYPIYSVHCTLAADKNTIRWPSITISWYICSSIKSAPVGLISTKLRLKNIQCNNSVYVIGKLDVHKPQKLTEYPSPRLILPGMQIKAIITEQRLGSKLLNESQPCSTYYF